MAKAAPIISNGKCIGHLIFCPACQCGHAFYNNQAMTSAKWTFNGNLENPTFQPSMLIYKTDKHERCHSYVTDGKIKFLNDSTHVMAGKTVELPEV